MAIHKVTPDESRLAARMLASVEEAEKYYQARDRLHSNDFQFGDDAGRKLVLEEVAKATGLPLQHWQSTTGLVIGSLSST